MLMFYQRRRQPHALCRLARKHANANRRRRRKCHGERRRQHQWCYCSQRRRGRRHLQGNRRNSITITEFWSNRNCHFGHCGHLCFVWLDLLVHEQAPTQKTSKIRSRASTKHSQETLIQIQMLLCNIGHNASARRALNHAELHQKWF